MLSLNKYQHVTTAEWDLNEDFDITEEPKVEEPSKEPEKEAPDKADESDTEVITIDDDDEVPQPTGEVPQSSGGVPKPATNVHKTKRRRKYVPITIRKKKEWENKVEDPFCDIQFLDLPPPPPPPPPPLTGAGSSADEPIELDDENSDRTSKAVSSEESKMEVDAPERNADDAMEVDSNSKQRPGRNVIPLKVGIEKLTKFMNKMGVSDNADNELISLPQLADNDDLHSMLEKLSCVYSKIYPKEPRGARDDIHVRYSHIDFSFGDECIPKKTINKVLKKIAKDEGKKIELIQLSDDDEDEIIEVNANVQKPSSIDINTSRNYKDSSAAVSRNTSEDAENYDESLFEIDEPQAVVDRRSPVQEKPPPSPDRGEDDDLFKYPEENQSPQSSPGYEVPSSLNYSPRSRRSQDEKSEPTVEVTKQRGVSVFSTPEYDYDPSSPRFSPRSSRTPEPEASGCQEQDLQTEKSQVDADFDSSRASSPGWDPSSPRFSLSPEREVQQEPTTETIEESPPGTSSPRHSVDSEDEMREKSAVTSASSGPDENSIPAPASPDTTSRLSSGIYSIEDIDGPVDFRELDHVKVYPANKTKDTGIYNEKDDCMVRVDEMGTAAGKTRVVPVNHIQDYFNSNEVELKKKRAEDDASKKADVAVERPVENKENEEQEEEDHDSAILSDEDNDDGEVIIDDEIVDVSIREPPAKRIKMEIRTEDEEDEAPAPVGAEQVVDQHVEEKPNIHQDVPPPVGDVSDDDEVQVIESSDKTKKAAPASVAPTVIEIEEPRVIDLCDTPDWRLIPLAPVPPPNVVKALFVCFNLPPPSTKVQRKLHDVMGPVVIPLEKTSAPSSSVVIPTQMFGINLEQIGNAELAAIPIPQTPRTTAAQNARDAADRRRKKPKRRKLHQLLGACPELWAPKTYDPQGITVEEQWDLNEREVVTEREQELEESGVIPQWCGFDEGQYKIPYPYAAAYWPMFQPIDAINVEIEEAIDDADVRNQLTNQSVCSYINQPVLMLDTDPNDWLEQFNAHSKYKSDEERMSKGRFINRVCYARKINNQSPEEAKDNDQRKQRELEERRKKDYDQALEAQKSAGDYDSEHEGEIIDRIERDISSARMDEHIESSVIDRYSRHDLTRYGRREKADLPDHWFFLSKDVYVPANDRRGYLCKYVNYYNVDSVQTVLDLAGYIPNVKTDPPGEIDILRVWMEPYVRTMYATQLDAEGQLFLAEEDQEEAKQRMRQAEVMLPMDTRVKLDDVMKVAALAKWEEKYWKYIWDNLSSVYKKLHPISWLIQHIQGPVEVAFMSIAPNNIRIAVYEQYIRHKEDHMKSIEDGENRHERHEDRRHPDEEDDPYNAMY